MRSLLLFAVMSVAAPPGLAQPAADVPAEAAPPGTEPALPGTGADAPGAGQDGDPARAEAPELPPISGIYEIAVDGVTVLSADEVATIVYPFLGPDKTEADVAAARDAIERAYLARGYQVVTVVVPPVQNFATGLVRLDVTEFRVGRLRVRDAEYTTPETIREGVPSLQEGTVPNLDAAVTEIAALNTFDRRIDFVPGQPDFENETLDVELFVDESLPLHGRLELNNRNTENTKPLRLNASIGYNNLFQLGHSLNLFYQVAPERRLDSEFISAAYTAPVPWVPGMSVELFGFVSDSDVAAVGGTSVVGDGFSVGGRASWVLPGTQNLFHQASLTVQFKSFNDLVPGTVDDERLPIRYVPVTAGYFANLRGENRSTTVAGNVIFAFRQIGSQEDDFEAKRFGADGSFLYATLNTEHVQGLPADVEVAGRLNGMIASGPLINNEQLSLGGLTTVRGFFETAVLADFGIYGGVELRSPSLGPAVNDLAGRDIVDEWRVYGFLDGAAAGIFEALPEQVENFRLVSAGFGSRIRLLDAIDGSIDVGFPIVGVGVPESAEKTIFFSISAGM